MQAMGRVEWELLGQMLGAESPKHVFPGGVSAESAAGTLRLALHPSPAGRGSGAGT
jgi:hypothetical protein